MVLRTMIQPLKIKILKTDMGNDRVRGKKGNKTVYSNISKCVKNMYMYHILEIKWLRLQRNG